jgi:hypothetical protein
MHWIQMHVIGWPLFVAMAAGFALVAMILELIGKPGLVAWAFLLAWGGGVVGGYITQHVGPPTAHRPELRFAMIVTLVLVMLIPLAAVEGAAGLTRRGRLAPVRWIVGAVVGVATIPLVNLVSAFLGSVVFRNFH